MAAFIQEKLQNSSKEKYIYISHEHKDHFDRSFLGSLATRDFTFLVPQYRRSELMELLKEIPSKQLILCQDSQEISISGGRVTIFLDDSEMDRDSAILVKADGKVFLNLNDCKIHDRLGTIRQQHGPIDLFTAQFSGAGWHPVCYEYPKKVYQAISMRKMMSKFEAVARAIETIQPRYYWTSAGPACFLDPLLFHLNLEKVNIFPRAAKFLQYLKKRLKSTSTECVEPMPGDSFDITADQWTYQVTDRVVEDDVEQYLHNYAAQFEPLFHSRRYCVTEDERREVFERLKSALKKKLEALTLRDRVKIPLYFIFSDDQSRLLRVEFPAQRVEEVTQITETHYYSIAAPSWEVARVLDGHLTWEDFTLTFRMKLRREPDVYHVVIHGFLMMEEGDMNYFCARVLDAESNSERAIIEAKGRRYSINRFCPHQGADLTNGWVEGERFLVCPRHRWKFDLEDDGKCPSCDASIHAFVVEDH